MGFMDSGGQGAGSFADSFMNTYLGMRQDRRENANQELINKLRQDIIDETARKKAQEEAQQQGVGDLYQQANPGLMGTLDRPAIAEQGQAPREVQAARFLQGLNNPQNPMGVPGVPQSPMGYPNQPQQSFADRIGTQGEPFVAGQPAFRDDAAIADLRGGNFRGQQGNQPSAEALATLLARTGGLKESLTPLVALRTRDEATQARIDAAKTRSEDMRWAETGRKEDRAAAEQRLTENFATAEAGKNERAKQHADLLRALKLDPKPPVPTDHDKLYSSYIDEMKAKGEKPWPRYQFDVWLAKQKPDRMQDLIDAMNPGGKQTPATGTTSPTKDKYGFTIGETQKGYKYIGNNQWQKP